MQINIDKKTGSFLAIIFILILVIAGLTLNNNDDDGFFGMHFGSHMGMQSDSDSELFTGADVMFLQMMIPHHQQAVDISNLALKVSKDSELRELATQIRDAQTAEIIQMEKWLGQAGVNTGMGHSMDDMGGMLDDAELSALNKATGKTFDILWLEGMIGHHDGAIHMTNMIKDASNPDIKKFGQAIVKDQSAQILQMKAMLKRIS